MQGELSIEQRVATIADLQTLSRASAVMTGKHVALFLPSLRGGGAERSVVTLANAMAAAGIGTDLVLAQAVGPYFSEVSDSVRVVDLGARRVLAGLPALARYLRRERPHALISTPTHANIVAIWANVLAGRPSRLIVREANTIGRASASHGFEARWMPTLIRWFYGRADHVVAVSHGLAGDLARTMRVPVESINVIYNPVVTPDLEQKAREPAEHPWFSEPPGVVLAVGRLTAQKDFPTLLRAFTLVRRSVPVRLVILGEGEERPELESMIRDLGLHDDVSMPGFVSNPFSYMARARLFVLSSAWEGLPGALVQAMACGARVVSTDCPSGPAEILGNGQWGRVVPVGDESALAQAMEAALQDTETPDVRARAAAFGVEQSVDAYLTLATIGAPVRRSRELR